MTTAPAASRSDAILPDPGDIHRVYITWHHVDGSYRQEARDILIVDAEHHDGGAHIIWEVMEGAGADYLPAGDAVASVFPYHEWPEGAVNWGHSEMTATHWLALAQRVGTYTPRDPNLNSIGTLRDAARRELACDAEWRRNSGRDRIRQSIREITARLADLPGRRDGLIREALNARVHVEDLAADAGLSPARIYQIRDGRR